MTMAKKIDKVILSIKISSNIQVSRGPRLIPSLWMRAASPACAVPSVAARRPAQACGVRGLGMVTGVEVDGGG